MNIQFLGAAGTVTGSSYILTSGSGHSMMIDLGMFQGPAEVERMNFDPFTFDCSTLSGILLTHAHLDHCGRLPIVLDSNFHEKIYMTQPTSELAQVVLLDSANIARHDRKQALYDKIQAKKTFTHFEPVLFRHPFRVGDFEVTYRGAGHLMGAASIEIVDSRPSGAVSKIIFSGDLGNSPEDLLQDLEYLESAQVVVMESTYGDRLHPPEDVDELFAREINTVSGNDGVLLIPAFALERTQEVLHRIMHLRESGRIDANIPVYLDSPMADRATRIYLDHVEMFNTHIQQELHEHGAFGFEGLDVLERMSQSNAIRKKPGPKVIIAGSGMMVGGRIVGHSAYYLPRASTRVLIVGFQGVGTLGRQLVEGAREVVIDSKQIPVNATITQAHSMSSHADQNQLMHWLGSIKGVGQVVLTHGEDGPRKILADRITSELGIAHVSLPQRYESLQF